MTRATNGKALKPWKDENGNYEWIEMTDRNGHRIERQLYIDDEGIDYVSLGGFFVDRLVFEDAFCVRVLGFQKDADGNRIRH